MAISASLSVRGRNGDEFIFKAHQFAELLATLFVKSVNKSDEKGVLRFPEIAGVLVRFDHIASAATFSPRALAASSARKTRDSSNRTRASSLRTR
jgi:hypothetical protein